MDVRIYEVVFSSREGHSCQQLIRTVETTNVPSHNEKCIEKRAGSVTYFPMQLP